MGSSSGSDDSKDLKLRKRSKNGKDSKELKRQFGNESPRKRNDEHSRVMSPVRSIRPSQRSTSMSENSDFIMPELEPQISSLPKRLAVMKESESPKSIKKSKSRKEDKRNQKSIREFFSKIVNYDNVSSTSSPEDEVALKKDLKIQRNAVEKSYESIKGFLTSFESFQNTDRQVGSPKLREERTDE